MGQGAQAVVGCVTRRKPKTCRQARRRPCRQSDGLDGVGVRQRGRRCVDEGGVAVGAVQRQVKFPGETGRLADRIAGLHQEKDRGGNSAALPPDHRHPGQAGGSLQQRPLHRRRPIHHHIGGPVFGEGPSHLHRQLHAPVDHRHRPQAAAGGHQERGVVAVAAQESRGGVSGRVR